MDQKEKDTIIYNLVAAFMIFGAIIITFYTLTMGRDTLTIDRAIGVSIFIGWIILFAISLILRNAKMFGISTIIIGIMLLITSFFPSSGSDYYKLVLEDLMLPFAVSLIIAGVLILKYSKNIMQIK